MDKRVDIIFAVFKEQAQRIKLEHDERFNPDLYKKEITALRDNAKEAYIKKQKCREAERLDGWSESNEAFHKAAYEYFLYGLHAGNSVYGNVKRRIDSFNEEWDTLENIINITGNISEALDRLEGTLFNDRRLNEELSLGDYTDTPSDFGRLKVALAARRLKEYDSKFGPEAIFEKAGKHFAEKIFGELTRSKGRPKRSRRRDIEIFRAYQFMRLIKSINGELKQANLKETNISEVCELSFGNEELLSNFSDNEEIKWVLSKWYKVDGITVRAFLNSVSRGKARFNEDDWEYV